MVDENHLMPVISNDNVQSKLDNISKHENFVGMTIFNNEGGIIHTTFSYEVTQHLWKKIRKLLKRTDNVISLFNDQSDVCNMIRVRSNTHEFLIVYSQHYSFITIQNPYTNKYNN